ncbi:hypothetical protein BDZ89DRAFT_1113472 [Hymenopellis radicata]|nr:hypothetical protein BDZ89DRAFT_1113472 [Hymenopellis radicata]
MAYPVSTNSTPTVLVITARRVPKSYPDVALAVPVGVSRVWEKRVETVEENAASAVLDTGLPTRQDLTFWTTVAVMMDDLLTIEDRQHFGDTIPEWAWALMTIRAVVDQIVLSEAVFFLLWTHDELTVPGGLGFRRNIERMYTPKSSSIERDEAQRVKEFLLACIALLGHLNAFNWPHRLLTKDMPNAAEVGQMRALKSQADYLLRRPNDTAQDVLDQISTQLAAYATLSAQPRPVRQFPRQVLSQIFDFFFYDAFASWARMVGGRFIIPAIQPPGKVCKYWREVALEDRQVWSKITLEHIPLWYSQQSLRDAVSLILERSGSHPLTVVISSCDKCPEAIRLILEHAPRIEWLAVCTPKLTDELFGPLRGRLRSLKALKLHVDNVEPGLEDIFLDAPALQTGIFTGFETGLYSVIQLPYHQFHTVRGTQLCLPQSFCVDFLRRFTQLDLLELVRCNTSPEVEKHSKKVKKLSTKTMTSMQWDLLDGADVDWIGGMSKYIATDLETLCVTQRGFEPGLPFLPLTTLFLDKIPISSSELLVMLECLPQLTTFRFNEAPLASCEGAITDEILLRMTTKNKNPRNRRTLIVPALHTLLLVCSGKNFTDDNFGQMSQTICRGFGKYGWT